MLFHIGFECDLLLFFLLRYRCLLGFLADLLISLPLLLYEELGRLLVNILLLLELLLLFLLLAQVAVNFIRELGLGLVVTILIQLLLLLLGMLLDDAVFLCLSLSICFLLLLALHRAQRSIPFSVQLGLSLIQRSFDLVLPLQL